MTDQKLREMLSSADGAITSPSVANDLGVRVRERAVHVRRRRAVVALASSAALSAIACLAFLGQEPDRQLSGQSHPGEEPFDVAAALGEIRQLEDELRRCRQMAAAFDELRTANASTVDIASVPDGATAIDRLAATRLTLAEQRMASPDRRAIAREDLRSLQADFPETDWSRPARDYLAALDRTAQPMSH